MAFACRPRRDRARRADHRPRRDDPGARAGHRARAGGRCTAWRRSTSATTSPWSARSPARVAVMYAGRIVELGPTERALPRRPPTRTRAGSSPPSRTSRAGARWSASPGRAPSPGNRPAGCFFAPRCTFVQAACETALPRSADDRGCPLGALRACRGGARQAAPISSRADDLAAAERRRGGARAPRRPRLLRRPSRSCTTSTSSCRRASAWRWSASPGRARRRSPARSRACTSDRTGEILLRGAAARAEPRAAAPREARRDIQYVFQNPYGSLNPRKTVGQIVRQPLDLFGRRRGRRQRRSTRCSNGSPLSRGIRRPLSRPALRRRAPARGDRPRAGRQPLGAGLRRGHVGARRERAGRDRRAARRAPARPRPRDALRHAQPAAGAVDRRARGGDEHGADRRARAGSSRSSTRPPTSTRSACSPTPPHSRPRRRERAPRAGGPTCCSSWSTSWPLRGFRPTGARLRDGAPPDGAGA